MSNNKVDAMLAKLDDTKQRLQFAKVVARHEDAMANPKPGFERALVLIFRGLNEYASEVAERSGGEYLIGDDGVLGESWAEIAHGLIGLLNGEAGKRLDTGMFDRAIRGLAQMHGAGERLE